MTFSVDGEQLTAETSLCQIPSKFVSVHGSQMHYLEAGEGDPIIFLHGIPTSSFLWRHVIPSLSQQGRCIAPDLIGMGLSDKPAIAYSIEDHLHYIEGFIEALSLQNITFVLHAWGSVIGFHYASQHEKNIKALAFMESHIRPNIEWEMLSLPVQEIASVLDAPDGGYDVIMNSNYYVSKAMPSGVLKHLSDEEMAVYQAPYVTPGSARPIWQYLQELPTGKPDNPVVEFISTYSKWLQQTHLPKLLMYAMPGFNTPIDTIEWAKQHLSNLMISEIGEALHYPQDSCPQGICDALTRWMDNF